MSGNVFSGSEVVKKNDLGHERLLSFVFQLGPGNALIGPGLHVGPPPLEFRQQFVIAEFLGVCG
jgi:hypothetical protein